MSVQERCELQALATWLATFPSMEQAMAEKGNHKMVFENILNDSNLSRYAVTRYFSPMDML